MLGKEAAKRQVQKVPEAFKGQPGKGAIWGKLFLAHGLAGTGSRSPGDQTQEGFGDNMAPASHSEMRALSTSPNVLDPNHLPPCKKREGT